MAFDGSYPAVPGNKPFSVLDVAGPTSYVQYVPPSTGGQVISARQFGLQSIEVVYAVGRDSTGAYFVNALLSPFNRNNASSGVILSWETPVGAQAGAGANLSASVVRLFAIGQT